MIGTWESSVYVGDLEVFDDGSGPALYAGGSFTKAGAVPANNVARWDGSAWSALGNGVEFPATLAVFDDGSGPALYAGGAVQNGVGLVKRWDGSGWTQLGSGSGRPDFAVLDLAVFDDGSGPALFAAGGAPNSAHRVAKWTGSSWTPLGTWDDSTSVVALEVFDDGAGPALFAGGQFASSPAGDSYLARFGCARKARRTGW